MSRERLVESNMNLARRLSRRFRHPSLDGKDFEQAAMVGLLEAANRFDSTRGVPFGTYAWRFILGACYDAAEQFGMELIFLPMEELPEGSTPLVSPVDTEEWAHDAIDALPVQLQDVARCRFICGNSITETAELLGLTPRAVRRRTQTARAILREWLEWQTVGLAA